MEFLRKNGPIIWESICLGIVFYKTLALVEHENKSVLV